MKAEKKSNRLKKKFVPIGRPGAKLERFKIEEKNQSQITNKAQRSKIFKASCLICRAPKFFQVS